LVLVYFAFKKVNIGSILKQLSGISIKSLSFWLGISILSTVLIAYRWSLLIIKKPKISDVLVFTKSVWSSYFYGLFVPTSAAGDIFKWIIIDEKYPDISKSKLGASILLDRFIGMSMLVFLGFMSQFFIDSMGVNIPVLIRYGLGLVFLGCLFFYGLVIRGKVDLLFKHKWLKKFQNIGELVNRENSKQIIKCLGVTLISDLLWIWQTWIIGHYFGLNISFIEILIYLPIISTILILPISIAGFGAREQLYLFFLSSSVNTTESILLMSTMSGIIGIINSLLGGLITLTPEYKKSFKNVKQ
jgi:hypothetical protein